MIPRGKAILNPNWPEARYDLGVLFVYDLELLNVIDAVRHAFGCVLPIDSVFGCFQVLWAGGRMVPVKTHTRYSRDPGISFHEGGFERVFEEYRKRDVHIVLTFSSPYVEEKHLDDPSCNWLLKRLWEICGEGSAVAVSSEVLSAYIRDRYPKIHQKASIVKSATELPRGRTAEYYDELLDRFDSVYVHPDDNWNRPLLEQLSGKAERYELLINESCIKDCPTRPLHYRTISFDCGTDVEFHGIFSVAKPYTEKIKEGEFIQGCPHRDWIRGKQQQRNCNLSVKELKGIYDMGFRHFKLQGREPPWTNLAYDMARYIFEQDVFAPLWFKG